MRWIFGAIVLALISSACTTTDLSGELELAAERTEAQTALLDLSGEGSVMVTLPQIDPDLPPGQDISFPPPDLSQVPEEFRGRFQEEFDRAQTQLEEQLDRAVAEQRSALEGAIPSDVDFTFTFEGKGELQLPDRLHMQGFVDPTTTAGERVETESQPFEVVVIGDEAWMRQPDGTWIEVPGPMGPFGPLVLDTRTIADFLRNPSGEVEDVGTETIDGVETRHYRFTVRGAELTMQGAADHTWTVDVWIGVDDDLVRRFRTSSEGSFAGEEIDAEAVSGSVSTTWTTTATVDLHDFGADVDIQPPPSDEVSGSLDAPQGSSAVLYPFGGHISVSTG